MRLNTEHLLSDWNITWELGGPWKLNGPTRSFSSNEITGVYYRRASAPEVPHLVASDAAMFVTREARIALRGLYDALQCPWISSPSAIRDSENKPRQLRLASVMGLPVLETLITQDAAAARHFLKRHGKLVVKPLYHGELGGGRVVHTTLIDSWLDEYDEDVCIVPHLFQRFVPKTADYRVTVIDEQLYACRIDSGAHGEYSIDVRRGLPDPNLGHEIVELNSELGRRLVDLVKLLGLRFGAIDLVQDRDGNYWFLEINPNGQWAWIEERTGAPLSDALATSLIGPPR